MTTSVTRPCFTTQHQTCKTKTKTKTKTVFWSQTGLVLRPTVSDHITGVDQLYKAVFIRLERHFRTHPVKEKLEASWDV